MAINERVITGTTAAAPSGGGTGNQEEGLILHLDANDVDSYDGDGPVWYDITNHEYTPAVDPAENFNTVTYSGAASAQSITGVGFQPDMVWIKSRNPANNHVLIDSLRGLNGGSTYENLYPNLTNTQANDNAVTSLDSDGFSLANTQQNANHSSYTYAAWCFKAGGAPSGSDKVSIDGTSYSTFTDAGLSDPIGTTGQKLSVNTELGFSVVYTTSTSVNSNNAKLTHGLNQEPEMSIYKFTSTTSAWYTYHKDVGKDRYLSLNTADAQSSTYSGRFYSDSNHQNALLDSSPRDYVIYNFISKRGVSKVGSYSGISGSQKIYTGFEPAFVLIKKTNTSSNGDWSVFDNARVNGTVKGQLYPSQNYAESDRDGLISFNRDGFTLENNTVGQVHTNGDKYIYYAVAKNTKETDLIDDTDLELHLDPASYSGSGTTWTADTGSDATVVASRYDQELGDSFDISTDGESTIQIASGHGLNGTNFTLEFWFKWQSSPSAGNRFIYVANTGWNFFYYSGYGWRIANADVATGYFSNGQYTTVGKWHHCVIAQDSSNCKIYFDGELVKTQSVTSGTRSLGSFDFGSTEITADKPKCDIGQIRTYSSALTQDEVRQNFNFTKASYPNGFNGTISGATWSADYFNFDGSNDVITLNNSGVSSNTVRSYSCWFNRDGNGYLISNTNGSSYGAHLYIESGVLRGWVYSQEQNAYYCLMQSGGSTTAGTWHHAVMTWGANASDCKLYLDGVLKETESATSGSLLSGAAPDEVRIGRYTSTYFDGKISKIKMYDKVLTQDEVTSLYNEGSGN